MDLTSFGPIAAVLDAAYTALLALTSILEPLAGGNAAAFAVVTVTLLVRACLIPVGVSTMRAEATRRRLAPRLAELRRRFASDPQRLQRATMELYASEKASPMAGCLPLIAQAPVLSLVYSVFALPALAGHPNSLLRDRLLGVELGDSLLATLQAAAWTDAAVFAVILTVIAIVAWLTRRAMLRTTPDPAATVPASPPGLGSTLSFMPFMTVVVAAFVPLAASLYLAVSAVWTLTERAVLRRVIDRGSPGRIDRGER